MLKLIH